MIKIKLFLLALVLAGISAFYFLGGTEYLSPVFFKSLYSSNPILTAALFFVVYIMVTGLSLPGAAILTLAGGAILGFLPAFLLISFASTIGATLAFLLSRTLLRGWVQKRFSTYMVTINKGMIEDGAFYLFTLRLIPVIPFFVINLVMGLMEIKVWTFYWVSQLGMLLGTAVYINAGVQIGQIEELSATAILTPKLVAAFVLLGVFPLFVRKGVKFWKSRRQVKIES
ncbi:MAG: VTT domain-containing protein [Candidatus Endonucleobacter sp. (ex Gigantidas childressi)]|nr:VTT domain-containing protein [Candidatus Endonucleobacter sp. (ex Gigantidas childressi)]